MAEVDTLVVKDGNDVAREVPTLLSVEQHLGIVTEAAPATDTASSGLNGRLQRIAQRLTTALTGIVLAAGTNNIGDVDVLTVPADPMGANADAASASGSISAKLRAIATALGVTALDLGIGSGGSRTLRVAIDSAQTNASGDFVDFFELVFVEQDIRYRYKSSSL